MIFNSENDRFLQPCNEERVLSSQSVTLDDERMLWEKFEAQLEGEEDSSDDVLDFFTEGGFAESGDEEIGIPPRSGALIDCFPALESIKRESILNIVKQLIAEEIGKK